VDSGERVAALEGFVAAAAGDEPAREFLRDTARSYLDVLELLAHPASEAAFRASCRVYGQPREVLHGSMLTHRAAAERMLEVTEPLVASTLDRDDALVYTPEGVAQVMRERFAEFFGAAAPEVVVDPSLASKAAASSTRVRLRARTPFSSDDLEQLVQHEGFVHTATQLNGQRQPVLTALGLSAPRTTAIQEGLATFAELRTGAMDLHRLRRIALRVVAIDLAIEGADFIEVFRYFLDAGQSEAESAQSAARVFRGGDLRGRHVFTKDVVYFRGLIAVHTFLNRAIAEGRTELIPRLFVGRVTLHDVLRLQPCFEAGQIAAPAFVPPWATQFRSLAAYLSFSLLLRHVDPGAMDLGELWDRA
jgi:uncharacterized protein (TIGR02421 family)